MPLITPNFDESADLGPGNYKTRITGVEVGASKSSNTPMATWELEVFDAAIPAQNGQRIKHRTMLAGKGVFGIKDLYRAALKEELKGPFDTDMLLGKEVQVTLVEGRPQQNGDPSRFPEVKTVTGI